MENSDSSVVVKRKCITCKQFLRCNREGHCYGCRIYRRKWRVHTEESDRKCLVSNIQELSDE